MAPDNFTSLYDRTLTSINASCVDSLRSVTYDSRWYGVSAEPSKPSPRDYYAEAQAEVDAICTSLNDTTEPQ